MKAPATSQRLPLRRGTVEFVVGTEADHEAVYQTLLHVFHGPDRESFLGALSDPYYSPDQTPSRNLPAVTDGVVEGRGGAWHVRPWRQVELNDLMTLYDLQFAGVNGSVVRPEDYWRWVIGRRYAHVIWVACQGETVRGYAFVKDHKILEMATHPDHPQALRALLGRIRAEALERAYPEVIAHAPADHPV